MEVTVAICTWNRCDLLRQTLERMTTLETAGDFEWELLIVDNNCTDATRSVAAAFDGRLPVRIVVEKAPGLSNARNRALESARADLVIFTDDDVLVHKDWLAAFHAAATRFPRAAVFGGTIEPWFPVLPDPQIARAFPSVATGFCGLNHPQGEGPLAASRNVFGANMAVRRSRLDGLLFDPELGALADTGRLGDDTAFVRAVRQRGGEVIWVPDMIVKHYVDPSRMTLSYLTKYYAGYGQFEVLDKGMPDGPTLFGAPRWLWTQCGRTYVAYTILRFRGFRTEALTRLRYHHLFRGMIRGCRTLTARQSAGAH